jgi:hypothetical protein
MVTGGFRSAAAVEDWRRAGKREVRDDAPSVQVRGR